MRACTYTLVQIHILVSNIFLSLFYEKSQKSRLFNKKKTKSRPILGIWSAFILKAYLADHSLTPVSVVLLWNNINCMLFSGVIKKFCIHAVYAVMEKCSDDQDPVKCLHEMDKVFFRKEKSYKDLNLKVFFSCSF